MPKLRPLLLGAAIAFPLASLVSAHAHPGHALHDHGVAHAITSPFHLATLAVAGIGLFWGAAFVRQRSTRRLLQAAGVVAFLSTAVLWGMRV